MEARKAVDPPATGFNGNREADTEKHKKQQPGNQDKPEHDVHPSKDWPKQGLKHQGYTEGNQ